MKNLATIIILAFLLLLTVTPVRADDATPPPFTVEFEAVDTTVEDLCAAQGGCYEQIDTPPQNEEDLPQPVQRKPRDKPEKSTPPAVREFPSYDFRMNKVR